MGRIFKKLTAVLLTLLLCTGCTKEAADMDRWLETAALDAQESPQELYEKALKEDVLIVYTVSTRLAQTKESFEAAYPGLTVELRDVRSPSLIEAVEQNHEKGNRDCDVVLCNDNSGEFKQRLTDKGLVYPYLPEDIAAHRKEGVGGDGASFLLETEMLFYNSGKFDSCPIRNLWELTEEKYRGRIYMPNPLNSFSTYAFCGASMQKETELAEAYRRYSGKEAVPAEGENVAELFWRKAAANIVFTNSSDEVVEALSNGEADFGFCVSSKLRLCELGYTLGPVWELDPFSACVTSYSVMIARDSANVNTAKLFIRYLYGEADGKGEGFLPFRSEGCWSVREDVEDGASVPLSDIDLIYVDQDALIQSKERMNGFWSGIIRESGRRE